MLKLVTLINHSKKQATICIFINTEKGDLRDSHTVLICKGSCLDRYKAIEKLA